MATQLSELGFDDAVTLIGRTDKVHGLESNDPVQDQKLAQKGEYSIREFLASMVQFDISIDAESNSVDTAINSVVYDLAQRNHWLEKGEERFSLSGSDLVTMANHYDYDRLTRQLSPWIESQRQIYGTGCYLRLDEQFRIGEIEGSFSVRDNYAALIFSNEDLSVRVTVIPQTVGNRESALECMISTARLEGETARRMWCIEAKPDQGCHDRFNHIDLSARDIAEQLKNLHASFVRALTQREENPSLARISHTPPITAAYRTESIGENGDLDAQRSAATPPLKIAIFSNIFSTLRSLITVAHWDIRASLSPGLPMRFWTVYRLLCCALSMGLCQRKVIR